MATHSSTLAWRIPWTEEPGGLQSMELQGVEHNSGTSRLLQNDGYVYKYKHKPLSLCQPKSSFEFFHTTF